MIYHTFSMKFSVKFYNEMQEKRSHFGFIGVTFPCTGSNGRDLNTRFKLLPQQMLMHEKRVIATLFLRGTFVNNTELSLYTENLAISYELNETSLWRVS